MKALLIIDMQKDFMPGGPLPTEAGDQLVPLINQIMEAFSLIVATKDWHPEDHVSFAENHEGKKVGEVLDLSGVSQILWPAHCVQRSIGAEFAAGLDEPKIDHVIYKGVDREIDSYSAFFDNARLKKTGLDDYLKGKGVDELYVVGVATDYCVLFSVLDALDLGYKVHLIVDGCKGIDLQTGDVNRALDQMEAKGATLEMVEEIRV